MQMLRIFVIGSAMVACAITGIAQTSEPTPVTMSTAPTAIPAEAAKEQQEMAADTKELQELKAQNDEILKQQQAALDQLDELQKEAEQLRIFSKRG
jgi:molecular chaperone GrpE (heat shock protein)